MPINLRVYEQQGEVLVAAADEHLVGKTFRENGLRIDVKSAFYGTEPTEPQTLVNHLRACTIANLVGEMAVSIAVEHGFVAPDNILTIDGVPHAQITVLQ